MLQGHAFWAKECRGHILESNGDVVPDMMHKEIEVYVDDMIAKSQGEDDHVVNLRKLFEHLRKFQLKLNPIKCTFGATSRKLLGFVVSKKGIEIDPDKVRAIQDLPPP